MNVALGAIDPIRADLASALGQGRVKEDKSRVLGNKILQRLSNIKATFKNVGELVRRGSLRRGRESRDGVHFRLSATGPPANPSRGRLPGCASGIGGQRGAAVGGQAGLLGVGHPADLPPQPLQLFRRIRQPNAWEGRGRQRGDGRPCSSWEGTGGGQHCCQHGYPAILASATV